ncbi:uncharacterized protein EI97DRAFT_435351 [Westerdykella ornata]|uniref:Mso1 N-terminal domain-containing protein n=1 Tax=Westerdykella ornata TaxID=318751 RepID=A0A6A6JDE3_WESOR|nr:uncharacterized protein EI97DRAFT_435351 [Westerdykella ornata]KAF2274254.1 hypothetical protein EI97DRAFT_435351 [Westerdykella ornata]
MSSYISNLLTNTTSRYNSLRRQLLSDETDGDTEDDSHISRVLRAYYTEKGRPFPPWLPPDPKAPQAAPAQYASSAGRQQGGTMGRGGGLSDLWDAPQQSQQQDPMSLRRGQARGGGGPRAFQGRPGVGNTFAPESQAQGRPLPSQRAGSYQNSLAGSNAEPSPPPSSGSGSTAQERLKARLWGRSTSPAPSSSSTSSSPAPPPSSGARRGPFDRPGPQGGGRPPYPEDRSGGYQSGGGAQQNQYGMAANSPWAGNEDPYAPGGGYGGGSQRPPPGRGTPGGGRIGLPSGPRMRP